MEEVQAAVRDHAGSRPLRPVAGRSKTGLAVAAEAAGHVVCLDVSAIRGVIDYQPAECTFTARAGTRISEIEAMLAEHGQYLPFEPPFADRGATLGGTVASGSSGPGRLRYGGIRDFLLGVRFVDGSGRVIRGGGRVVKNAAGFYLQHLLLGSLGRLGVLTEITCKVFPRAQRQTTVSATYETLAAAVDALARLRRSPFELESAELIPPGRLLVRVGGSIAALPTRVATLSAWLGGTGAARVHEIADAAEERACWHEARELTWCPPGVPLVKVATTLSRVSPLDERLTAAAAGAQVARRYGAGGEVAWLAWPHPLSALDALLTELSLPGLVVLANAPPDSAPGPAARATASREAQPAVAGAAAAGGAGPSGPRSGDPLMGPRPDAEFLARVKRTLDPRGIF